MRQAIIDVRGRKVQSLRFFPGVEELADGTFVEQALPSVIASRMDRVLREYIREREAVYGCLFLVGKTTERSWCAPLILYPATLRSASDDRPPGGFEIDLERWRLNPAIEALDAVPEELATGLESLLPEGRLTQRAARAIAALLAKDTLASPDAIDTRPMADFPVRARSRPIRRRCDEEGLALLPASALFITERGRGVRGLLDELKVLADQPEQWSAPLRTLIGGGTIESAPSRGHATGKTLHRIPAVLSAGQERILESARHADLTLCHGPPGTGKSFTLAALAVDHVSRGHSVLMVSRSDHAVDVVEDKIHELLGGDFFVVRAGRRGYLRQMKVFLHDYLRGALTAGAPDPRSVRRRRKDLERLIDRTASRESWLESELRRALDQGEIIADQRAGWLSKLHRKWIELRLARRPLLAELAQALEETHEERIAEARESLRLDRLDNLARLLETDGSREQLRRLRNVLVRRRSAQQFAAMSMLDVDRIAKILPVWLVSLADLHRVVPFQSDLFDLVVIDEASQCDLASVLPALVRGRRAVIAGDQRQLRHVPFVSRMRMDAIAERLGVDAEERRFFDYRLRSSLDVAVDRVDRQQSVGFLNEHFRSRQAIIAFSNERFYGNRLTIMKERPWDEQDDALIWRRVAGRRDAQGANLEEAEAIVACLERLIAAEPRPPLRSIGILSPFRTQIETIRSAIECAPGGLARTLRERHRLLLGTAHSFQGEERDVMLLSFAVDKETSPLTLRFLERRDVFNVSITRAKSQQIVFSSLDAGDLPESSLLGAYLSHIESRTGTVDPAFEASYREGRRHGDRFADELGSALARAGCQTRAAVTVAGVKIDLLISRDDRVLGVDLIGHPGTMRGAVELARLNVLTRAGFRLLPVGFAEWRARPEDVVAAIMNALERPVDPSDGPPADETRIGPVVP